MKTAVAVVTVLQKQWKDENVEVKKLWHLTSGQNWSSYKRRRTMRSSRLLASTEPHSLGACHGCLIT